VLLDREIGAISSEFLLITLFLFFIMVNTIGALLGFVMSGISIISKTNWGSTGFWGRVAFGVVVLMFGVWLFTIAGQFVQTSPSGYYSDQGPNLYFSAAVASVIFGISWLIAMIAERRLEQI
jgi:hypothetical protein